MNLVFSYPSQGSFLDPQLTKDGKPYGPLRYEEIVKERYIISKNIHTSYSELGKITPLERKYILKYLFDEAKQRDEQLKKMKENKK